MPKLKQVSAKKYTVTELYGLQAILKFANGDPEPISVVDMDDAVADRDGKYRLFSSYGDRLQYIQEAFEFRGGRILVCATVSTWGGTFASHDEISLKYFGLEKR